MDFVWSDFPCMKSKLYYITQRDCMVRKIKVFVNYEVIMYFCATNIMCH